jgi:hypothetical protein
VQSTKWLGLVTEALIVPPPILGKHDYDTVAMKLANAVSFNIEGPGKTTAFDTTLAATIAEPTPDEMNLSSGMSYPTPTLNGAAVAMRLETYVNLPSQDLDLQEAWPANLDLSLNLWLCADGIDMIQGLEVTAWQRPPPSPLPPDMAARFAAAWMDEITQKKFFNAYVSAIDQSDNNLSYLYWQTLMAKAGESSHFTKGLPQKCRGFKWYAETVNHGLAEKLWSSTSESRKAKDATATAKPIIHKNDDDNNNNNNNNNNKKHRRGRTDEQAAEGDDEYLPDLSVPIHKEKLNPSKPLCKECLEIVQQAKPVDISFVDVSDGHRQHPHLGARDEWGQIGYVHDETDLHRHPEPFDLSADHLRTQCLKRDNNYRMLTEKVFVDLDYDKSMQGKPRPKLFCLVYTIESGHPKIPSIRKTWA